MNVMGLLVALLIGAVCGFLAGKIVRGHGFGLVGNIAVGIVGALLFGLLFGNFSLFGESILNEIAGGTLGAVILLLVIGLFKKAT
ncbi:GlsB/YeaQ/YmgE family stress response membrane protein [Aeoliella sp.]|uniref:GlsB/YeaQ/YmgE family stress response membrane protein n=1 Tax=Aeoliella sp. TaxID=2795800 RepID=UPI003CCB86D5